MSPQNNINARIADRIRTLRKEHNLTLDNLAKKSRVSRSMISLIEREESSPTAVALEKIATGLGVALATLFEEGSKAVDPVARSQDRGQWRDPQTGYVRRNVSPATFPSPLQIVDVEMPAGATVAYETGARDVNIHQQIWVQKGQIDVTLGTNKYSLFEDDCFAMKLDEPMTYHNPTDKIARYCVVIATERSYW